MLILLIIWVNRYYSKETHLVMDKVRYMENVCNVCWLVAMKLYIIWDHLNLKNKSWNNSLLMVVVFCRLLILFHTLCFIQFFWKYQCRIFLVCGIMLCFIIWNQMYFSLSWHCLTGKQIPFLFAVTTYMFLHCTKGIAIKCKISQPHWIDIYIYFHNVLAWWRL